MCSAPNRPSEVTPSEITPEHVYLNRRSLMKGAGLALGAAALAACRMPEMEEVAGSGETESADQPETTLAEAGTTDELGDPLNTFDQITNYNNYYEFTTTKTSVWRLTGPFRMRPWTVTFSGLCNAPGTWDVDALEARFGIEERLYRLRCVEAWSITVPWIGYPLSKLIELAEPQSSARYVAFRSFHRPEQARGQESGSLWPWPYYEGLRLDEAMNELAFVVTGAYGEPLPKQNGAPLRLALPWKYGFKSIKGILEIEFTDTIPPTFWSDYAANEYGFYSNVNPDVPQPRWSQDEERQLYATTGGEQQPTLLFNGYSEFVGDLYDPELLTYLS